MNRKDVFYILLLVGVLTFFLNDCSNDTLIERKKVTLSDTVWTTVNKVDTTYLHVQLTDTIIKPVYKKAVQPLPNRNDSLRLYTGVYKMPYGYVYWSADVTGYLEQINFTGSLKMPEIKSTQIGTITKTVEITKLPRWNLYAGVNTSVGNQFIEVAPSVDLRLGKLKYSYSYGLLNQTHTIGVQTKIF